MKKIVLIFVLILLMAVGGIAYKLHQKEALYWITGYFDYLIENRKAPEPEKPVHLMFLFVDHFEPRMGDVSPEVEIKRNADWLAQYCKMAENHYDSDGVHPQHNWFYPYDQIHPDNLLKLSQAAFDGFGEIEIHLHHSNDTEASLTEKFNDALFQYGKVGAQLTAELEPQNRYAFIHGNWALDNSRLENNRNYCGVNNELTILAQTGCFADFTFPAFSGRAQPHKINTIYYAYDDPAKSKSYDDGIDVKVGGSANNGFLIFEGPLLFDWGDNRHFWYPVLENGEIEPYFRPTVRRVDLWVKANIHVKGRPEWVFVKVFTHSAREDSREVVCGTDMDLVHTYLEKKYNDGENYLLHYVTAREAHNIVKAAEAGKTGNPNDYRDFLIPPYANRKIWCNKFYNLRTFSDDQVQVEIYETDSQTQLKFHHPVLVMCQGKIVKIRFANENNNLKTLSLNGIGHVSIQLASWKKINRFRGAKIRKEEKEKKAAGNFLYLIDAKIGSSGRLKISWQ